MKRIIEKGVVISEYPPGATPKACYFPERNRLISAWCRKILVVEAGEDSGALLTAHIAVLQKKEVYAVPNNIYQNESKGTNRLIQKGAFIYLEPQQLLLEGFHVITTAIANENLEVSSNYNSLERSIIDIIKNKPSTIDEIMQILKHSKIELLEQIAFMEIEGKLKSLPGGKLTV